MEIPIPTPVSTVPIPGAQIPLPSVIKKSFFNSEKKIHHFAKFLIIAGLGAFWLTYWYKVTGSGGGNFGLFPVIEYYIFNSGLLLLLGIFLYMKSYRLYSLLSVVLGVSVTISMFIFQQYDYNIFTSLFFSTVFLGVSFGSIYGGFIFVPMFLWGVYLSAIRGLKHLSGKVIYNPS